jgi:hypothetical protein
MQAVEVPGVGRQNLPVEAARRVNPSALVKRKGLLKGLLQWCHGAGSILHRAQGGSVRALSPGPEYSPATFQAAGLELADTRKPIQAADFTGIVTAQRLAIAAVDLRHLRMTGRRLVEVAFLLL